MTKTNMPKMFTLWCWSSLWEGKTLRTMKDANKIFRSRCLSSSIILRDELNLAIQSFRVIHKGLKIQMHEKMCNYSEFALLSFKVLTSLWWTHSIVMKHAKFRCQSTSISCNSNSSRFQFQPFFENRWWDFMIMRAAEITFNTKTNNSRL